MEIIIYAALGPSGEERALARRLLAEGYTPEDTPPGSAA